MALLGYTIDHLFIALLISFRIGAFFMASPIFSQINMPLLFQVFIPVSLSFLLVPVIPLSLAPTLASNTLLVLFAIMTEVMVGVLLGFALKIIFLIASVAGEFAGIQVGFAMASLFSPDLGQIQLFGLFIRMFLIMFFFAADMHHDWIRILARTYEQVPPGTLFLPVADILPAFMKLFSSVYELGIHLGLPIVAIVLLFQITIGVVTITAPQMNFYFNVALSVNPAVGLIIIGMGFFMVFRGFEKGTIYFNDFLKGVFGF